jgi:hypothetical protein
MNLRHFVQIALLSSIVASVRAAGRRVPRILLRGITVPPDNGGCREIGLLSQARIVFFNDSVSLQVAQNNGVTCPVMEFGPDGAFGVDLRDDAKAVSFLTKNDLTEGKLLCSLARPKWGSGIPDREIGGIRSLIGGSGVAVRIVRTQDQSRRNPNPARESDATMVAVLLIPKTKKHDTHESHRSQNLETP